MHLECIDCGKKHDLSTVANTCSCDGLLEIRYDFSKVRFSLKDLSAIPPHVWKYRQLLPISGVPISLMEGGRLCTDVKGLKKSVVSRSFTLNTRG